MWVNKQMCKILIAVWLRLGVDTDSCVLVFQLSEVLFNGLVKPLINQNPFKGVSLVRYIQQNQF
jgi:hypothetical protein